MQPVYRSIEGVFSIPTRHVVPLFQRPYVWNEANQWQPLWEDISGLIKRIANEESSRPIASHFLGTIVLDQKNTPTGVYAQRAVIDGQQRLTTLQIILKASIAALKNFEAEASDEAAEKLLRKELNLLERLVANPGDEGDEETFKVWPTNDDRAAFRSVMSADAEASPNQDHNIGRAFHFFRKRFQELLSNGVSPSVISRALRDEMKLIVLDLEPGDEPQAIFETLNAHGQPLLPADLIKNWLLWEASRQTQVGHHVNVEALYKSYWLQFDADAEYWRKRVGTGHAARVRVDTFFQNWLTIKLRRLVSAKSLYQAFLEYFRMLSEDGKAVVDLEKLMSEIADYAALFRSIDEGETSGRWGDMTRRLGVMKLVAFMPLIMEAMAAHGNDEDYLQDFATSLESYHVRRMFSASSTRGYGTLVVQLLDEVFPEAATSPDDDHVQPVTLTRALAHREGSLAWPSDTEFKHAWTTLPLYRSNKKRVSMVLQALEGSLLDANGFGEPVVSRDWSKTQIEHILPKAWQDHYPLAEDTEEARLHREACLDRVGNLTLITGKMNQSYKNAAWTGSDDDGDDRKLWGKRRHLQKHSGLNLNLSLLDHASDTWSESDVLKRSNRLFEHALSLWPKPVLTAEGVQAA